MKTRNRLVLGLLLFSTGLVQAQDADSLMSLVLHNNKALKAARETANTAILRAGKGNNPPDPELEFGYLFGDPAQIGHKINVVVKQEADFPTAYAHRSQLRKIRTSGAELEYRILRQEVLAKARSLWIEQLYLNQLSNLLFKRHSRAEGVFSRVEIMSGTGEVDLLKLGQAKLMLVSVEAEREEVLAQIEINHLALDEICGGKAPLVEDNCFPESRLILLDSLRPAYLEGPAAMLFERECQQKQTLLKLAKSEHLPRFSAGYFSEAVTSEAFRGFTVGFSVPLWENANSMKTARSEIVLAEAEKDHFFLELEKDLEQKIRRHESLSLLSQKLEEALGSVNSMEILAVSLKEGEISLSEYFYTSDLYFRNQQLLLSYKREMLILEEELYKIYL